MTKRTLLGNRGRPKGMTIEERFWEKVDRRAIDQCWPWTGCTIGKGYGRFVVKTRRFERTYTSSHRYSWELHFGAITNARLRVLHSCDNYGCVNPEHLMLGTQRANVVDAAQKGRLGPQIAAAARRAEATK